MSQTHADTVLPCFIAVGVEILVDLCVGLFYLGTGSALEIEVQGLEDIPPQLEIPVPEEALAEGGWQRVLGFQIVQVALLQFVVGAVDICAEGDVLRSEGEVLCLDDIQPFGFPLELLEWLPGFPVGVP